MSIAVIKTGGKQYKVKVDDIIKVEKVDGDVLDFDDILSSKKVKAKVISTGKRPKVRIFKFGRRKGYRRNIGHRQEYSEIKIESIK